MKRNALFLLLILLSVSVSAQQRSLHWKEIAVDAQLDREGSLQLRERQHYIFSGDWNGGERSFNLALGQELVINSITRIDPVTGAKIALTPGDLTGVDQWGRNGNRVRWRSRLPSDPPFNQSELIYLIDYTISPGVRQNREGFELDHDFAFTDREGTIEHFTLDLQLDEHWQPVGDFRPHAEARNLQPGQGFDVDQELRYLGSGFPRTVARRPGIIFKLLTGTLLLGISVVLIGYFLSAGLASTRFDPLIPPSQIDEAWLRQNVFSMLPEVAGAAWDDTTGASEVSAILARLVQEKKLRSLVEKRGVGPFRKEILHLELAVDRSEFKDYERKLIDKLFFDKRTGVDTEAIRKHFEKVGFDPAATVKSGIERGVKTFRVGKAAARSFPFPTWQLLLVALPLLVFAGIRHGGDAVAAAVFGSMAMLAAIASILQGFNFQKLVGRPFARGFLTLLPLLIFAVLTGLLAFGSFSIYGALPLFAGYYMPGTLLIAGLITLYAALLSILVRTATSPYSLQTIELKRKLLSARNYFRWQLQQREPQLLDDWYPYLIAFGLGTNVDKWFQSFGGESTRSGGFPGTSSTTSSGTSSSTPGSSTGWTGGGGAFGGAGSSGAWAAAAGTMASGLSAPSSSGGSSGGGGGGSSSGGGGGGGW